MKRLIASFIFLAFTLQACSSCLTYEENFRVHLGIDVGRHIDKVNQNGVAGNHNFVESKIGKDGLLDYRYARDTRLGKCVYTYKVDPDTKLIKGWIIEHDEGGCFVPL